MSYTGGYNQYDCDPHAPPEGYHGLQFDQWGRLIPTSTPNCQPTTETSETNQATPSLAPTAQTPYYALPVMNYQHYVPVVPPLVTTNINGQQATNSDKNPIECLLLPPIQRYAINYQSQRSSQQSRGGSGILDFYVRNKIDECVKQGQTSNKNATEAFRGTENIPSKGSSLNPTSTNQDSFNSPQQPDAKPGTILVNPSVKKNNILVNAFVKKNNILVNPSVKKNNILVNAFVKKNNILVNPSVKKNNILVNAFVKKNNILVNPSVKKNNILVNAFVKKNNILVNPSVKKNNILVNAFVKKNNILVNTSVKKNQYFSKPLCEEKQYCSESPREEKQYCGESSCEEKHYSCESPREEKQHCGESSREEN
ncbi:hypothetical protein DSO57_1032054 [Entomophthora muscae]|uniref:Uncharacterized protein n=1 Tax=Entomophthora muscae TaxID=34485 RepID=A0ACC2TMC6_9FUNG|nr:hypothetical protein DSO57_1032054 [Entomophthora muscae]